MAVMLVIGLLLSIFWLLWARLRRAKVMLAGLPSYPQLPLIGNLLQFTGGGKTMQRRLKEMSERSEQTALPFVVWFATFPLLVISDPDDVKTINNTFIDKPHFYNFAKCWLGEGLITASGSIWKENIKTLGNTFSRSVVNGYQTVFNAQALKLVKSLRNNVGQKPFCAMQYLELTTLETICQTALGVPCISDCIVTKEYYDSFNSCSDLMMRRGMNLLLHCDYVYRLTRSYKEMNRCLAILHKVSETVIETRKKERSERKISEEVKDKKFKSFLDILLDKSATDPRLTEQQIKSEVDTIIVAAQDTVATALLFTLLIIGSKPEVQEKLHEELSLIFGESDRPVEKDDLNQMHYCEAVICESLRLYPPVPAIMRYADHDVQLKSCKVPKGTFCGINIWGVGRSERSWGTDAVEFKPERWLLGNTPSNAASYLPFSYGKRTCIGKKYAMNILKTTLAYCVREFKFYSEADKLELKLDVVLRPISGHLMQVTLRRDEKEILRREAKE